MAFSTFPESPTSPLWPSESWHHSFTFPAMPKSPHGLGIRPHTGSTLSFACSADQQYSGARARERPKKKELVEPALQAYSHSTEVGRR